MVHATWYGKVDVPLVPGSDFVVRRTAGPATWPRPSLVRGLFSSYWCHEYSTSVQSGVIEPLMPVQKASSAVSIAASSEIGTFEKSEAPATFATQKDVAARSSRVP